MTNEYQKDLDDCKKWMSELLDYANSLRDIIRAVNGKTVEQIEDEAVRGAEDLADCDDHLEHLKQLRKINIFAVNLLSVIVEAREKGWYRLELGYLKVRDDGVVIDRRMVNTKKIVLESGERIYNNLVAPHTKR